MLYRDRFLRTRVVFKIVSKYSILRLLQIYKYINGIYSQAISVEMYRQDYIQKIIFYLLILLRTQFTGTFELTMRKQWSILIISM